MNGGLANQLFQWAVVTTRLLPHQADLVWDYRRALRPNGRGRQLGRLAIDDEPALLGSRVGRALEHALERLPDRLSAPLMARLPSIPPARALVQVKDRISAETALAAGRSIWIRDYLIDPTAISDFRIEIRQRVRPALDGLGTTDGLYACVHVRRGDYLDPIVAGKLGPCGIGYYVAAIRSLAPDMTVRVVSDDPDWCLRELVPAVDRRVEVVRGRSDLDDLATISGARAIVMSNSTFSWWGAFLSDATSIVGPSPFFDFDPADSESLTHIAHALLRKTDGASLTPDLATPGASA